MSTQVLNTSSLAPSSQASAEFDIAVVIVNWNVRELLRACLASLPPACEGLRVRTVVVDNASRDGSVEMVREEFPDIEVVANEKNVGFGPANNQALAAYAKRARYLLLLNPDTVVAPDVFHKMIEFMDANPDTGIAGCKVIKPDGTLDWPCKRSFITPDVLLYKALGLDVRYPDSPKYGRYQLTYLDEDKIHEVDAVVGAFMMVRAECMERVGMLDESIFMYGEDLEWCYRAKRAGWKVHYVPTSYIVHHKGQSSGKRSYKSIYYWYHCTWMAYDKQIAAEQNPLVNAVVWAGFHAMCAVSLTVNLFKKNKKVPGRV